MEKRRGGAMSNETLDRINLDDGDDDVQFLSQIEAAEAQALSIKRRRFTSASPPAVKREKLNEGPEVEEGAYIAALKGSKSQLWQKKALSVSETTGGGGGGGAGGDVCFKCGKVGHWARDCESGGGGENLGVDALAEKACRCGVGMCSVLTANTERNRGRKFYKCPVREENGGCGFFEWCDKTSATNTFVEERARYNVSQQAYPNHPSQGPSGFTKASSDWKNDNHGESNNVRVGSTCFKCNKEGHWARDCPTASSNVVSVTRGNSASSGACYKCGKPGHWARDCPQS